MKTFYLTAVCALFSASAFAQNDNPKLYLHQLNSEVVPDEYKEFFYNDQNLLDSTSWGDSEHELSSTFVYDDNNNIVGIQVYQIINFDQYKTPRYEYEYDEFNRITVRRNYNAYPGMSEMLSGTRLYSYDENGNMSFHETYLGDINGELYDQAEYEYNDKNLLVKETVYGVDYISGGTDMVVTGCLEYTYDDMNRIHETFTHTLSGAGSLLLTQKEECMYDENNNLTSVMTYLNRGSNESPVYYPAREHKFVFDTEARMADVVFPIDPEYNEADLEKAFTTSQHKITGDTIYSEFEGVWGLYDIREFVYTDVRPSRPEVGVENTTASEASMYVLGDRIYLSGVKENTPVQIYDQAGRLVMSTYSTAEGIPAMNLPKGLKIIKAGELVQKFF